MLYLINKLNNTFINILSYVVSMQLDVGSKYLSEKILFLLQAKPTQLLA